VKHCSWGKYIQLGSSKSVAIFTLKDHCIALFYVYFYGKHLEDERSLFFFSFFLREGKTALKSRKGNDGKQKWRELKMAESCI
jgi:hypothetical protein